MTAAFRSGDLIGMLMVSIFDTGALLRVELLLEADGGRALATEIVLIGIERNDGDDAITKLAYEALAAHSSDLPLASPQADILLKRLQTDEDALENADAAAVFRWIAHHHRDQALALARAHVAEITVGDPDELDIAASRFLGASYEPDDHSALLDYAGRCAEAGHFGPHSTILGHLTTVTDDDVARLLPQLGQYVPSNAAPGPGLVQLLGLLTIDQIRILGAEIPTSLTDQWFTGHLLPHLFEARADELVGTLHEDWWPEASLTWILGPNAPSNNNNPALLSRVLHSVHRRGDPPRVKDAHQLILRQTLAAPAENSVRSAMPRLGARILLAEALQGNLDPDSPEILEALNHLPADLRLDEYRAARWRQKTNAGLMAKVIAGVDVNDVEELISEIGALKSNARVAFLTEIASHLTEDIGARVATAFRDDEPALAAVVAGPASAEAVLHLWEETCDLAYFRALASTDYSEQRLAPIPNLVRDYSSDLTAQGRRELISTLELSDSRYELLLAMIHNWEQHPGPGPANLEVVLELVSVHLKSGADPEPLVEAARPLSLTAPLRVRKALYAALAAGPATPAVVSLIDERRSGEAKAGKPAVMSTIDAITERLKEQAGSDDPHEAVDALKMLDQLQPKAALPFARRLARTATNPDKIIIAIRILGQHGDRTRDPALLREIADGEDAHPDPRVRTEATRAIRRLEIGDLDAAHERLGMLTTKDPSTWMDENHNPTLLYGSWADALQEGLDRIAQAETAENWRDAIDQLDEVAKVLLYRALEVAGSSKPTIAGQVQRAQARDPNYGGVVRSQQLHQVWQWTTFFETLHAMRTAHITQTGSTIPPPKRMQPDFDAAKVMFRDGAGPCCDLIASCAPQPEGQTQ